MKFILFTIALVAVAFASQRSKKDHSVINVPASSSHQAFSYRVEAVADRPEYYHSQPERKGSK